tara:strand:+ start:1581 stop:2687 length:1107 start_codon:yes stop_codon:yes gene_type:complete
MTKYIIRKAIPNDNEALCALFEIPMSGDITLSMERNSNYFKGSEIQNQIGTVYIAIDSQSNKLVGSLSYGKKKVYLNEKEQLLGYFSDLRIHPDCQGTNLMIQLIKYLISKQPECSEHLNVAMIITKNNKMINLINRASDKLLNHLSVPKLTNNGTYQTILFPYKKYAKISPGFSVRIAQQDDILQMTHLMKSEGAKKQGYPIYDLSDLNNNYYNCLSISDFILLFKNNILVAMCSLWDQSSYKATRVVKYSQKIYYTRLINNLFVNLFGGISLPKEGEIIKYVTLHSIAVKENSPVYFHELLKFIQSEAKGVNYILCGLAKEDKLQLAFKHIKRKRIIEGNYYQVSSKMPVEKKLPNGVFYMEASRL